MDSPKILLADDHRIVRSGLLRILKSEGFADVIEAQDGRQAVDLCVAEKPDIALLDIQMPHLSGLEACREIKALNSKIKIIILTMHEADDMRRTACDAGADNYLLKNEAPERLAELIAAL
jgi:two-component system response regulator DegU